MGATVSTEDFEARKRLERAVLGMAIISTQPREKFSDNTHYYEYNGHKLPPSNHSELVPGSTYMQYDGINNNYIEKTEAIWKYIDYNILNSDTNTKKFLDQIYDKLFPKAIEYHPDSPPKTKKKSIKKQQLVKPSDIIT